MEIEVHSSKYLCRIAGRISRMGESCVDWSISMLLIFSESWHFRSTGSIYSWCLRTWYYHDLFSLHSCSWLLIVHAQQTPITINLQSTMSSPSSILLTPIKKESTTNLTPPLPPSPATKLIQFPPLPNLVDLHYEDYEDWPTGFFLLAPISSSSVAAAKAIQHEEILLEREAPRKAYPRPLK